MNTDDIPTLEQRWSIIEVALQKQRVDTSKIKPLERAVVIARAESDEVVGADDEEWQEFAEYLVEKHPTWADMGFHRRKNAEEIISDYQSGYFGDPENEATAYELAESKYAVLAWYDGHSNVYAAGDTIKDVLEVVCGLHFESETQEHVEGFWDLDTGELHDLYGRKSKTRLAITHTLRYGDVEYISTSE